MILDLYYELLVKYGHQGWWPLTSLHHEKGVNPTKSGSFKGYHPRDYSYPKTADQKFEICLGAILTQNTAWPNVEKSLLNLKAAGLLNPAAILKAEDEVLKLAIRPSGYFNQKARKLREFAKFYVDLKGKAPKREELLGVWGIGRETADCILLYVYKKPFFVIDLYTRKFITRRKVLKVDAMKMAYDDLREIFEKALPKNYRVYQEYHALIVEDGKH
jgi:endonuclease III related protein